MSNYLPDTGGIHPRHNTTPRRPLPTLVQLKIYFAEKNNLCTFAQILLSQVTRKKNKTISTL